MRQVRSVCIRPLIASHSVALLDAKGKKLDTITDAERKTSQGMNSQVCNSCAAATDTHAHLKVQRQLKTRNTCWQNILGAFK